MLVMCWLTAVLFWGVEEEVEDNIDADSAAETVATSRDASGDTPVYSLRRAGGGLISTS